MADPDKLNSESGVCGRGFGTAKALVRIALFSGIVIVLYRIIIRDWESLSDALARASLGYLLLAMLCFISSNLIVVFCWHAVLFLLGADVPFMTAFRSYFYSGMTKYIPGKIWGMAFRIIVAGREGVREGTAALGVVFESILLIASASFVGGIAFTQLNIPLPTSVRIMSFLLPFSVFLLHPSNLKRVIPWLGKRYGTYFTIPDHYPSFLDLLVLLWGYCGIWVMNGLGLFFLSGSIRSQTLDDFVPLVAGNTLAWLAGFITVLSPAGLGVREIVLTTLLGSISGASFAALVAVMSRAMMIITELLGALIAAIDQYRTPKT